MRYDFAMTGRFHKYTFVHTNNSVHISYKLFFWWEYFFKKYVSVAEMTTRRSGAGVGVVDGLLYAVGGHDGPTVRKSAEVFNPQVKFIT